MLPQELAACLAEVVALYRATLPFQLPGTKFSISISKITFHSCYFLCIPPEKGYFDTTRREGDLSSYVRNLEGFYEYFRKQLSIVSSPKVCKLFSELIDVSNDGSCNGVFKFPVKQRHRMLLSKPRRKFLGAVSRARDLVYLHRTVGKSLISLMHDDT